MNLSDPTKYIPDSGTNIPNPKQAKGDKKVPLHLVPPIGPVYIAIGLREGVGKYGAWDWRDHPVKFSTYYGAALRHLAALQDGETLDPGSGNPHLAHAMASLTILADSMERGNFIDDRPPPGPAARVLKEYERG